MDPDVGRALVGLALGAATAILAVTVGTMAAIPVFLVVGWSLLRTGRRFALGGILLGFGGTWLALVGFRILDPCGPGPGTCVAPDLLPFALAALIPVAAGTLLFLWGWPSRSVHA